MQSFIKRKWKAAAGSRAVQNLSGCIWFQGCSHCPRGRQGGGVSVSAGMTLSKVRGAPHGGSVSDREQPRGRGPPPPDTRPSAGRQAGRGKVFSAGEVGGHGEGCVKDERAAFWLLQTEPAGAPPCHWVCPSPVPSSSRFTPSSPGLCQGRGSICTTAKAQRKQRTAGPAHAAGRLARRLSL